MFFKSRKPLDIKVDIHSHLIPGVDDGVKSIEEALLMMRSFNQMGYQKLIITPHISENYYPNSAGKLKETYDELLSATSVCNLDIEIVLGAEYMVDDFFLKEIIPSQDLLSWNGFILVESSFINYPMILNETLFELQQIGLIPVYAHPERYPYFHDEWAKLQELKNMGVNFQINSGSLIGHYGKGAKKMAEEILKREWADFIGSDAHHIGHLENLRRSLSCKSVKNLSADSFRNNELV